MTLHELIKKLKAFDCDALKCKEVAHYFVSKDAYGYEEIVTDVMFDPVNGRIVLVCEDPKQKRWESQYMVKNEVTKVGKKMNYDRTGTD